MTSRRRFLAISAAAFACPVVASAMPMHTWQGVALGGRATLRLTHPDAVAISQQVAAEIARLENIFSLYRTDSALSRLNRTGGLDAPPFELLECLSVAGAVHAASGGRFDPTIQTLWNSYAQASLRGSVPDTDALETALARTGWEKVVVAPTVIEMAPGMALTLNGIAQGYIADRVARMLIDLGLTDILIDTGEFRAVGGHPAGGAWPVNLVAGGTVPLAMRSLATSAPLGTTFDQATVGHILDPRTGKPARATWREISVSADTAALADALSTAACLMASQQEVDACLAHFSGVRLEAATRA